MEDRESLSVPEVLGQYLVLNVIQPGSTCVVVRARHVKTKEIVAIKVVSRQGLREKRIVLSFEEELRLQGRLDSQYVTKLLDVLYFPDYICLVLEYLETDLYSLLVDSPMRLRVMMQDIFFQMVSAIAYLHEHGIVHRDIKPENILIDDNGNVKLCDFGCSADLKLDNKPRRGPCGTLYYMAPETFLGQECDLKACDISALGVILYSMAVGVLPWANVYDEEDVKKQIIAGKFELPDGLHPRISRMIQKCMKVNPSERPTAQDLLNDVWCVPVRRVIPKDNSIVRPIVVTKSFNVRKQARLERGALIMRHVRSSILRPKA